VNGKSISFSYKDLVSHGLQQTRLMCFLGREEWEDVDDLPENEAVVNEPKNVVNIYTIGCTLFGN